VSQAVPLTLRIPPNTTKTRSDFHKAQALRLFFPEHHKNKTIFSKAQRLRLILLGETRNPQRANQNDQNQRISLGERNLTPRRKKPTSERPA
tara:strand:- start:3317 stop:3592 length:276 start_codon:yes stop_codon:yes gene_type:complete